MLLCSEVNKYVYIGMISVYLYATIGVDLDTQWLTASCVKCLVL